MHDSVGFGEIQRYFSEEKSCPACLNRQTDTDRQTDREGERERERERKRWKERKKE